MDYPNKPLTSEMLLPVLAETMKFATQALAETGALSDVLIAKGVLTKAELDAAMLSTQKMRESLLNKLDEESRKQS